MQNKCLPCLISGSVLRYHPLQGSENYMERCGTNTVVHVRQAPSLLYRSGPRSCVLCSVSCHCIWSRTRWGSVSQKQVMFLKYPCLRRVYMPHKFCAVRFVHYFNHYCSVWRRPGLERREGTKLGLRKYFPRTSFAPLCPEHGPWKSEGFVTSALLKCLANWLALNLKRVWVLGGGVKKIFRRREGSDKLGSKGWIGVLLTEWKESAEGLVWVEAGCGLDYHSGSPVG